MTLFVLRDARVSLKYSELGAQRQARRLRGYEEVIVKATYFALLHNKTLTAIILLMLARFITFLSSTRRSRIFVLICDRLLNENAPQLLSPC